MGEVIPFPDQSRWPSDRPGLRKPNGPWRTIDLKGRRPSGHPAPEYGPRGRVKLAIGQVWVECHSQELYVVKDLVDARCSLYSYDVVLIAYKRERIQRVLAEATIRCTMQVWDRFESERRKRVSELCELAEYDPESPWRGTKTAGSRALAFFGMDEDGYRID